MELFLFNVGVFYADHKHAGTLKEANDRDGGGKCYGRGTAKMGGRPTTLEMVVIYINR